ncbi:MAG: hypothetical protein GQ582_06650, partial [Methyloprofundus sp.]|nr:hypothetical protein [Methyloprofundus sp.]
NGPKVGSLFSYIDRELITSNFRLVDYSVEDLWLESCIAVADFDEWLTAQKSALSTVSCDYKINAVPAEDGGMIGRGIMELTIVLENNKKHIVRLAGTDFSGEGVNLDAELDRVEAFGESFVAGLRES